MAPSETQSLLPKRIEEPKIILTEGADAKYFCIWAYQAFGLTGFQVIDFGGVSELPVRLKTLIQVSGFGENAKAVVVVRDAEASAAAASNSVRSAFHNAGLPVPDAPFITKDGSPRTAFILFPGLDDSGKLIESGTLEDLCLATVDAPALLECVKAFLDCSGKAGTDLNLRHKMMVHAYLAGTGKKSLIGMKIGEAAKSGAWAWNHPRLKPLKDVLSTL